MKSILLIFTALFVGSIATSQGNNDASVNRTAKVNKALENEIKTIVANLTDLPKFYVNATVSTKTENPQVDVPYSPNNIGTVLFGREEIVKIMPQVTALTIEIFVDETVSDKTTQAITRIIVAKLSIPDQFAGNITFTKLPIVPASSEQTRQAAIEKAVDEAKDEAQTEMDRLSAEMTNLQVALATLEKDRSDIERERNDLKAESLQKQNEVSQRQSDIEGLRAEVAKLQGQMRLVHANKDAPFWEGNVIYIVVVSIAILGWLIGSFLLRSGFSGVAGSLSNIGQAIKSVAGASGGEETADTSVDLGSEEEQKSSEATAEGIGIPQLPPEAIEAGLVKLREQIEIRLKEGSEAILVSYLTKQLKHADARYKAILLLEFLGGEYVDTIVKKLGVNERKALSQAGRSLQIPGHKPQLMLNIADELVTLMSAKNFHKVMADLDEELEATLLQFDTEDKVNIVSSLNPTALPRFILYLNAEEIAIIMEETKKKDEAALEGFLTALANSPKVREDSSSDKTIKNHVENVLNTIRSDDYILYQDLYGKVLAGLSDDAAENFVKVMSQQSENLSAFFQKVYVSFNSFFELSKSQTTKVLERLSAGDIAFLISLAPDDKKATIKESLSERRLERVEEEETLLKGEEGVIDLKKAEKVKPKIIRVMKDLKTKGEIGEDIVDDPEATAEGAA